jgi:hypothetical protein
MLDYGRVGGRAAICGEGGVRSGDSGKTKEKYDESLHRQTLP